MNLVLALIFLISIFQFSQAKNNFNSFKSGLQSKNKQDPKIKFKEIMSPKTVAAATSSPTTAAPKGVELPAFVKLLIGAGGIYAAFLYYGTLQEDVFHYTAADGTKFKSAWFLQTLEALANVLVGGIGLSVFGATSGLPQNTFAMAGAAQVCAKAFTSLALANGVAFPVVTLAKSGKMIPVMMGSLIFGKANYTLRQYLSVLMIIAGTCIVSMGKKKDTSTSSMIGLAFIFSSLTADGVAAGMQEQLKAKTKAAGKVAKPYDLMFWTNLYMAITAFVLSLGLGELTSGTKFCLENPKVLTMILKFALCSAFGQSFIFYTIANFNSLVCTTVTTTRKVFSVLLSIFLNGHSMSPVGWAGLSVASLGILSELQDKSSGGGHHGDSKTSDKKPDDKKKK